jgi:hypothetical protein|eukprot:gene10598-10668_t
MKNDKLIPGLILVLIGAAILLSNFGYLHFRWYNIFHLWPILLVIGGINLVFAHNKTVWATVLKISVVVLGFGLILFGNFGERYSFWPGSHFSYNNYDMNDDDDDDSDSTSAPVKMSSNGTFNEPYKADIKYARLEVSGGGITYSLSDTTNQLFSAATKDTKNRYEFTHSTDDSVYVVNFKMKDHKNFHFDSEKNDAVFRLNPNPIWDINIATGATALNFDLSKFKVKELNINGGFASFKVKLGAPLTTTNVDISTGLSGSEISIPKDAACSIETDSGLSDNHFDGFNKTDEDNYETPGFSSAKNKIIIHISGGLSDFKVHRY